MPVYEYRREDGTTFEVEQRITADPLTTCPTTGQMVSRVISGGTGLIFKGSGFYLTDYARKNSSPPAAEDAKGKESSQSATSKESDASTSDASKPDSGKAASSSSSSSDSAD